VVGTGETGLALSLEFVVGVSRTTLRFLFQHTSHTQPAINNITKCACVHVCVYVYMCVCLCCVCG
jgi:hypothetical protein